MRIQTQDQLLVSLDHEFEAFSKSCSLSTKAAHFSAMGIRNGSRCRGECECQRFSRQKFIQNQNTNCGAGAATIQNLVSIQLESPSFEDGMPSTVQRSTYPSTADCDRAS
mmetsp:Transcript_13686/g.31807  ORF Transcript_13686/g.31807 Transcript_13686/m.31807 type:complete len:110 (-) Transcript_13686:340-669(-)